MKNKFTDNEVSEDSKRKMAALDPMTFGIRLMVFWIAMDKSNYNDAVPFLISLKSNIVQFLGAVVLAVVATVIIMVMDAHFIAPFLQNIDNGKKSKFSKLKQTVVWLIVLIVIYLIGSYLGPYYQRISL